MKVHRGFNGVFSDGLYEQVLNVIHPLLQLKDAKGELYYNNTIHFGGHSLGGANAQMFGTYYAHFFPSIKTYVTTLGAPRQGNYVYKLLAESLPNLNIWRMVNCRDVVPRVPLFQYYHAGHLLWRRCDGPGSSRSEEGEEPAGVVENNDVVEAYYRDSGQAELNFAKVPTDSFIVRQNEPTIISDHLGVAYMEWLEYSLKYKPQNWTQHFETIT